MTRPRLPATSPSTLHKGTPLPSFRFRSAGLRRLLLIFCGCCTTATASQTDLVSFQRIDGVPVRLSARSVVKVNPGALLFSLEARGTWQRGLYSCRSRRYAVTSSDLFATKRPVWEGLQPRGAAPEWRAVPTSVSARFVRACRDGTGVEAFDAIGLGRVVDPADGDRYYFVPLRDIRVAGDGRRAVLEHGRFTPGAHGAPLLADGARLVGRPVEIDCTERRMKASDGIEPGVGEAAAALVCEL